MKTKRLASREFSASPNRALVAVSRSGLVTADGKPKAIMIPTSEELEPGDLTMLDHVALTKADEAIRIDPVVKCAGGLAVGQLDAEIASARAARRRK